MEKIIYALIFIIGIFVGEILIDASHLWSRYYYDHNLYIMYFLCGSFIGLVYNYFFKEEMHASN